MAQVDITGIQHYTQGIGHPKADVESLPPVEWTDSTGTALRTPAGAAFDISKINRDVVLVGDSITAYNYQIEDTPYPPPYSSSVNNKSYIGYGYFTWANALLYQAFNVVYYGGVSGQRTDSILARVPALCNLGAGWFVEMSGTNDVAQLNGIYGGNATLAENSIVANRLAMWRLMLATNAVVIVMGMYPAGLSQSWSAAQLSLCTRVNRRLKALCAANGNLIYVDSMAAMVDQSSAAGVADASKLSDGLHPNALGAYALGKQLYLAVRNYMPMTVAADSLVSSQLDCIQSDTSSKNLLTASQGLFLSGTSAAAGAGMSGTQVTAWAVNRQVGSGTAVASVVPDSDGVGNAQRLVITSGGAGEVFRCYVAATGVSISNVPAGTQWYAESKVVVSGATGLKGCHLEARIDFTGSAMASPIENDSLYMPTVSGSNSDSYTVILRTPLVTLPVDATGLTTLRGGVYMCFNAAGGATVDVSRVAFVRAN